MEIEEPKPLDMLIFCPNCGKQHVDKPEPDICKCGHLQSKHHPWGFLEGDAVCEECRVDCIEFKVAWNNPPHKSHTCRTDYGGCGKIFRIADFATNGVAAITTKGKDDTWQI